MKISKTTSFSGQRQKPSVTLIGNMKMSSSRQTDIHSSLAGHHVVFCRTLITWLPLLLWIHSYSNYVPTFHLILNYIGIVNNFVFFFLKQATIANVVISLANFTFSSDTTSFILETR